MKNKKIRQIGKTYQMKMALSGLWLAMFLLILPLIGAAQEKIVFESHRDGNTEVNSEVYVMNSDGSNQTNLTNNPRVDWLPSFSPDGSKIVYTSSELASQSEIYMMNSDGTNQTNLTNNPAFDSEPSFSPDGSRIVFVSSRDGNQEIYVMDTDGSSPTRLTNNSVIDFNPSFSPNGSKIAFVSNRDGNYEIYVMNADGSNQTRVTFFSPANDFNPSFSPNGSTIAFVSNRDGNQEIYVMNSDGSNQVRLTNNPASDSEPSFSPDGSRIAFASSRDGNSEIYVMNADGSNPTRLTFTEPFGEFSPSWGGQAMGGNAPTLSNVAASLVSENSSTTLSGNLSNPNAGDSFKLTVNWGDGSAPQVFNYPAGTTSFAEAHQYLDDNPTATNSDNYTVNLTLTTAGGSDTDSAVVTVNNVAPVLSNLALNPSTVTGGSQVTLSGTVNDVGTQDQHTVVIDWGDGSPATTLNLAAGVTSFNASHTYNTTGSFTITVTASDDDGGTDSETLDVNSVPPPPPAAPTNLRVDAVGANHVELRWTDNANNEGGFVIEQCRNRNCGNFVEVGQIGANVTTFTHGSLLNNTQYSYRVRAFNLGGNSAYSNTATVKTLRR